MEVTDSLAHRDRQHVAVMVGEQLLPPSQRHVVTGGARGDLAARLDPRQPLAMLHPPLGLDQVLSAGDGVGQRAPQRRPDRRVFSLDPLDKAVEREAEAHVIHRRRSLTEAGARSRP